MRFIIYGTGAIGGALAVRLTLSGYDVVAIARGAQYDAIKADGLRMKTPDDVFTARFPVVQHPGEIAFRPDDVILLTMKTQDTRDALEALRAQGVRHQTVACMQNGVANEPLALRYFDNVLGVVVMMPVTFVEAGEVIAFGTPKHGIFDIGRYPSGTSGAVNSLCDAFNASGFAAFAHGDVMRAKYGKLLLNLNNGIDSALGPDARDGVWLQKAREEALAVYEKAGIAFDDVGATDPRRDELMNIGEVAGASRVGSSAAQSLHRGAGSIEVDYLNGEIVWLGRLHGVPVPVNAFFTDLAQKLVAGGKQPGSMSEADIDAAYAAWSG